LVRFTLDEAIEGIALIQPATEVVLFDCAWESARARSQGVVTFNGADLQNNLPPRAAECIDQLANALEITFLDPIPNKMIRCQKS
jgi:hypothetical protein